jgi:hypothetical protein
MIGFSRPSRLSAAAFGDDVPVVRSGSPFLQLLAESEQIKAAKQTDERRGIAIAMRVAFSLDLVDDESVGSDTGRHLPGPRSAVFGCFFTIGATIARRIV